MMRSTRSLRGRRRGLGALAWAALLVALAGQLVGCASQPRGADTQPKAATHAARAPAPDLEARTARPPFWKIESASGATLFLLGSMHVGPQEGWRYTPSVDAAFADSSTLIVELDVRNLSAEEHRILILRYAMLPDGESLRSRLTPHTWDLLVRQMEHSQLDMASLERLQPWMVSNLLVVDAAQQRGLRVDGGVDRDFLQRSEGKQVLALESPEQQLALMSGLSRPLQEYSLLDTLGHPNSIGSYLEELVETWRIGDTAALSILIFDGLTEHPDYAAFFEELIFKRNREMATKIAALLEDETYRGQSLFAVIGAGHVVGSRSVGALLAERGYDARRIEHQSEQRDGRLPDAAGPRSGSRGSHEGGGHSLAEARP